MRLRSCQAKEKLFTFAQLFQQYVARDAATLDAVEKRTKIACDRTRTSRCETLLLKAFTATTKSVDQMQEAVKKTLVDHAKLTKQEAELHFFAPLLTEANRILSGDQATTKAKAKKK